MRTIKLLIMSFTLTFLALMSISPAIAKPLANVQHLQVNNMLTTSQNSYDSITILGKTVGNISTQYDNNFSTGLILSSSRILTEENSQVAITVVNKSNDFFTSAMIVSDKVNQFISYFTSPDKKEFAEQTKPVPKSEVLSSKCSKTVDFS